MQCYINPHENNGYDYMEKNEISFEAGDFDHFEKLRSGPDFELRLAGGAYRFHKNKPGFWELLVDSKHKKIYGTHNKP